MLFLIYLLLLDMVSFELPKPKLVTGVEVCTIYLCFDAPLASFRLLPSPYPLLVMGEVELNPGPDRALKKD